MNRIARSQTRLLPPFSLALVGAAIISLTACSAPGLRGQNTGTFSASDRAVQRVTPPESTLLSKSDENVRGGNASADRAAAIQQSGAVARRASRPYLGSTMVPVTAEDRLPAIFRDPFTLDFRDARAPGAGVPLSVAMSRLSRMTQVAVRISPDVYAASQSSNSQAPLAGVQLAQQAAPRAVQPGAPMPSPVLTNGSVSPVAPLAQPSAGTRNAQASTSPEAVYNATAPTLDSVDMLYSGTLAGYLNMVTDRLGLSWEYRDSTIVVSRVITETHEIFAFDGSSEYQFSTAGAGSGSAGGSGAGNSATSNMQISEKGKSDPVSSIEKAINDIIASVPGSAVTRTEGSGRFVVRTSREAQGRIRDYVKAENLSMRRQAQIQFDVYSVVTDLSDEQGINWTGVLNNAAAAVGGTLSAPATLTTTTSASIGISVLPNVFNNKLSALFANSSAMVNALSQQGYSVQHRPVSLLAMNRQWARINRLNTEGYLSETTPGVATTTGAGAPGLKTKEITTGDQYVAMPQIMDDNTVLLKFGLSLSDLLGLFDVTSGSGSTLQKVQVPKVSAVNAQFPIAIRPGEVVAVTGLSRVVSTDDRRTLSEQAPVGLGGSTTATRKREHFIVFIRPILL